MHNGFKGNVKHNVAKTAFINICFLCLNKYIKNHHVKVSANYLITKI